MADFQTICRTCMRSDGSLMDLFGPLKIENNSSLKLADVLMEATPLQVAKEDGLPQKLCDECTKIIQIIHTFRNQALSCDNELKKNLLVATTIKNESTETDIKYENVYDYMNDYDNFFLDEVLPNEDNEIYRCETCHKVYNSYNKLLKHKCVHKDPDLVCSTCHKRFHSKTHFKKHMSKHSEKDYMNLQIIENDQVDVKVKRETRNLLLECPECDKVYNSEKSLLSHLKKHKTIRKGEPFKCNICDEQFILASSFIDHKNGHFNEKRYTCLRCLTSYWTRDELERHIESHNESKDEYYECSKCDLVFEKYKSLLSHLKKHASSGKTFKCNYCDRGFSSKGPLKRHLALHSEERPFKCTECPKCYSRQDELATHMRKHSGIKPYACDHCDKAFMQLCSLKDHLRTHTGETPFLCSECGKGFNNSSNLRQHLKRHTGIKPFACTLCPKSFCTKGQMKSHMDTHTGAHPYKCNECGSSFTKPNSLKKHKMIHLGIKPFACDSCNMSFNCKDHLKRHLRKHTGEKPYKCARCDRAFTQSNDLVKHMRRHVGQNIYSCTVCGAKFRLLRELKRHYPIHYAGTDPATIMDKPLIIVNKSNDGESTNKTAEGHITITFNRNILDKDSSGDITINIGPERMNCKVEGPVDVGKYNALN